MLTGRQVNGQGGEKKKNSHCSLKHIKDLEQYISYFDVKDTPSLTAPQKARITDHSTKQSPREQMINLH